MKKTIEELKTSKAALELLQNETNEKLTDYKVQISLLQKQIDDHNKPELTPMYMDKVFEAIEEAVDGFDFDDTDNYNIEYGIDYDGRVHCENFDFCNAGDLVQEITDNVMKLFKEAECPDEDNDNQENQD